MATVIGVIIVLVLLAAVWYWRKQDGKKKPAVSQSDKTIHSFLATKKDGERLWELYRFIDGLSDKERQRRGDVVCKVGIHFSLDRYRADAALTFLETQLRDGLGDKTFAIVKGHPAPTKTPEYKPRK
ncbi:MAG: hypothetical protein UT32_C0014G0010 [Parcubacteria group bacterium GW2011_GWC2_39_14]|nr:MAG: hypothetical protein UT32_C0014G0010 [Parcubacteria group bacterium GW2011_GWC2_39_14]KKR54458.1 MAG: hypothetical protein UT91_C0015G0010 [Parcubacteria group bacterium GW2011_GWA2_40_23]